MSDRALLPNQVTPPNYAWRTPDSFFRLLNREFGPFELDAAADASNAKCDIYFSTEGLADLGPTVATIVTMRKRLSTWSELWAAVSPDGRRRVLREMVSTVRLDLFARDVWLVPRAEWEDAFALRRKYRDELVGLVRPGGLGFVNHARTPRLYSPAELCEAS